MRIGKFDTIIILGVLTLFFNNIATYSIYHLFENSELLVGALFVIFCLVRRRTIFSTKCEKNARKIFISCLLVLVSPFIFHFQQPFVSPLLYCLEAYFLLSLNEQYQDKILAVFIRCYAFILLLCLVEYFVSFVGITFIIKEVVRPSGELPFFHGIINLFPYYYQLGDYRFQAFQEEPGSVGGLCAFLIALIDKNRYKKEFYVFLGAGVFSFSLAFYILISLYALFNVNRFRLGIKTIFTSLLIVSALLYANQLTGNIFTTRIVERLSVDDVSEIDNRNSDQFKKDFNAFLQTSDIFIGKGNRTFTDKHYEGGNAGGKVVLYQYGLFPLVFLLIVYTAVFFRHGISRVKIAIYLMFLAECYNGIIFYSPLILLLLYRQNIDFKGIIGYENYNLHA